jgi:hypothetical protein
MITATITVLDDERLIREGETAVDGYNKDLNSARQRIMPMARGLLAARRKYPANQGFSDWLHTSSYREISHQDRAALIEIGEREWFAEKFIRTTFLTSPRTILEAITELMPSYHSGKTPPGSATFPTPQEPAPQPEQSPDAKTGIVEKIGAASNKTQIKRDHPFYGLPRAEEVTAAYPGNHIRKAMGAALKNNRIRTGLWQLVLDAFDAGFLVHSPPDAHMVDIRILLPQTPRAIAQRYPLDKKPGVDQVMTIWPIVMTERGTLLANPADLDEVIRAREVALQAAALSERNAKVLEKARAAMQPGETEVEMFGERFWPRTDVVEYDYGQLATAAFFFDELDRMARLMGNSEQSPKSRSMTVRHALKWLLHYMSTLPQTAERQKIKRVIQLVDQISRAMERNPTAESRFPLRPNIHGDE